MNARLNPRVRTTRRATASLPLMGFGVALVALVGCGGEGEVSGKITYKGKNVPIGYVVFHASDERTYDGVIADGAYRVTVPAGEALVAIWSDDPTVAKKLPPQHPKGKVPRQPAPKPWPAELEKKWFKIPEHYGTHLESELKFTVRRGENTFNVELVDKAK